MPPQGDDDLNIHIWLFMDHLINPAINHHYFEMLFIALNVTGCNAFMLITVIASIDSKRRIPGVYKKDMAADVAWGLTPELLHGRSPSSHPPYSPIIALSF
jgi:hypothetical protein